MEQSSTAAVDEACLLGFVRRDAAVQSFQISEIADFQANIGCPAEELLPRILRDDNLHKYFSPLLARLRVFPVEISAYVNLQGIADVWSGELRIAEMDCTELFVTLSKLPQTLQCSEPSLYEIFVHFVSTCVASDSIELSEAAAVLFCILARNGATDVVPLLLPAAQRHLARDSTLALRYGALLCRVAGCNDRLFSSCLAAGGVDLVMQLLRTPDELVQIVALESIAGLFNTESGLAYMIRNGHIKWLVHESCDSEKILSSYALRATADFFLKVAEVLAASPTALADSELLSHVWGDSKSELIIQFLDAVMMHMDSTSDATRLAALAAITSFVSSSLEALYYVAGMEAPASPDGSSTAAFSGLRGSGGAKVLESWVEMLRLKMDIQAAVLTSMATTMLATQKGCRTDEDFGRHAQAVLMILRRAGEVKNMAAMDYILKLAAQPVPIGKFAAFEMFRSLASLEKGWGLDILFSHSPFADFIMNQVSESSYEAKERKYAIIEAIAGHPSFLFLNETTVSKLKLIKNQGPHYLPASMREMQTLE